MCIHWLYLIINENVPCKFAQCNNVVTYVMWWLGLNFII